MSSISQQWRVWANVALLMRLFVYHRDIIIVFILINVGEELSQIVHGVIVPRHKHNLFWARKFPSCGSGMPYGKFDNRPGASCKLNHDHVVAVKQCSPVDRPSTNSKISFAGRSAVAGKSEKKTQRRIDSFTFFIPSAITVKEETGDWFTATPEQIPTTRKQEYRSPT